MSHAVGDGTGAGNGARALRRRLTRARRRILPAALERPGALALLSLVLAALLVTIAMMTMPSTIPLITLAVPLLVGSQVLGPRQLPWYCLLIAVLLVVSLPSQEMNRRIEVGAAVLLLLCLVIYLGSVHRSRLGVAGMTGEAMLVDLRDRILAQGEIPELPQEWYVDAALTSAGGTPFAGDFIVTSTNAPQRVGRFDVVLVDVSGKGEQAGTRALLLSGAMGGLLTALPPEEFLPATNHYLLRQAWDEGFATAVHLSLELTSGRFEVRTAGHPPAAHLAAGSGRWSLVPSEGPILGLLEHAEFVPATGVLRRGDTLLLYTDGMVETRTRDIGLGIDRMTGQVERLLRGNFHHGAARLVEAVGSRNDDRALVLVHRR